MVASVLREAGHHSFPTPVLGVLKNKDVKVSAFAEFETLHITPDCSTFSPAWHMRLCVHDLIDAAENPTQSMWLLRAEY